jgi:haloacetate dehalogenase
MFLGFTTQKMQLANVRLHIRIGGSGPPLLLLHGYPQTHVMWHKIAPALAQHFTLICPDMRGYGDSDAPPADAQHLTYAKRTVAQDLVELMANLGFARFMAAGHDRGARVLHRLLLDHPARVRRAAMLDIVPTRHIFKTLNQQIATVYEHWFFLIQPDGFPERLIGQDPDYYLTTKLHRWSADANAFAPEAMAEYLRCFRRRAVIHATCEDYRAAASIDLAHDESDLAKKIDCPLLVLWGQKGAMEQNYDVLAVWREQVSQGEAGLQGRSLPCGHFLAEEAPEATFQALHDFFNEQADNPDTCWKQQSDKTPQQLGLSPTTLDNIVGVLSKYAEVESAIVYGSRAKGNYREGSDIDLTLNGQGLTYQILLRIEDEIDELLLPYLFDISILSYIEDPDVVDHIRRVGVLLYAKGSTVSSNAASKAQPLDRYRGS